MNIPLSLDQLILWPATFAAAAYFLYQCHAIVRQRKPPERVVPLMVYFPVRPGPARVSGIQRRYRGERSDSSVISHKCWPRALHAKSRHFLLSWKLKSNPRSGTPRKPPLTSASTSKLSESGSGSECSRGFLCPDAVRTFGSPKQ
jgi:hypothetical protein